MRLEAAGKSIKTPEVHAENADADGNIDSAVVDRLGYDAARVAVGVGAPTGSPTALTASLVIQHGDASDGSDMADFETVAEAASVLAGGVLDGAVNLRTAKRYVRVRSAIAFTGGSSPAADVGLACTLAGADELPK